MKKGLVYYEVIYPGKIFIDNSDFFKFKFENDLIGFKLLKHVKILNISEYDNFVKYDSNNKPKGFDKAISNEFIDKSFALVQHGDPLISIEFDNNQKRISYDSFYSHLIIFHEIEDIHKFSYNQLKIKEILDFFISIYRSVSNDQYIYLVDKSKLFNPINNYYIHTYSKEDLEMEQIDRMIVERKINWSYDQLSVDRHHFNKTIDSSINPTKVSKQIKKIFETEKEVVIDESSKFLMIIDDKIHTEENHTMIFLELFIFIETITSKFLNNKKIENGVSKSKLKEYETEVSMSYMINIELPMFIKSISQNERKVIGEINKLRRQRNNIVHNGDTIDFQTLLDARKSSAEYFNLLRSN